MALINTVGPPVEGEERFWDREADLKLLTERLDEGNHVRLVAQRRMGKTSLLREVSRRLSNRYACLFVDVQKHESPAEVIAAMGGATRQYAGLWQQTKATFGNIVKAAGDKIDSLQVSEVTVHLRAGMAGDDWRAKGDALFEALAQVEGGVVLMLDEVPILVNRMMKGEDHEIEPEGRRQAELFLSWLRENALRHTGRVRLVVSGSIGLTPVLHRAGLSATANYLIPFELPPWGKDTAVAFLRALAEDYGLNLSPETCDYMVERIGCCIPHHLQMYFFLAETYCRRNDKAEFSQADAEEVYLHDMLGPRGNTELVHYE
ncbi:MAG: ATP-binding protein, partial [Proteobacteria bacterium]|nr:ATP-binding protein [Pseudomonadota bacterium]